MRHWLFGTAAALIAGAAAAQGVPESAVATKDDYLIARQGKAEVWAIDVDAHLASMPEKERAGFIDSPKRIQQLLGHMLLRRNLANEAKELGLDKDPVVQRELMQAAEVVLMRHRLDAIRERTPVPDVEPLAKEKFMSNREAYQTKEKVSVVHILLDTTKRSEAEAVAQLTQWKADIEAGKAKMEDLAKSNSDDPGVASNGGLYQDYDANAFVPEFAGAVRQLANPGDVSAPVKTEFGYHLIQLRSRTPAKPYAWEEIKDQLIAAERDNYLRKTQADHVEKLKALPIEASEESVAPLRQRYGTVQAAPVKPTAAPEAATSEAE
jgi:parvulin-like peptidyl-prolyl isomerase